MLGLYITQFHNPKSAYSDISGVYPAITSNGVRPPAHLELLWVRLPVSVI